MIIRYFLPLKKDKPFTIVLEPNSEITAYNHYLLISKGLFTMYNEKTPKSYTNLMVHDKYHTIVESNGKKLEYSPNKDRFTDFYNALSSLWNYEQAVSSLDILG